MLLSPDEQHMSCHLLFVEHHFQVVVEVYFKIPNTLDMGKYQLTWQTLIFPSH